MLLLNMLIVFMIQHLTPILIVMPKAYLEKLHWLPVCLIPTVANMGSRC